MAGSTLAGACQVGSVEVPLVDSLQLYTTPEVGCLGSTITLFMALETRQAASVSEATVSWEDPSNDALMPVAGVEGFANFGGFGSSSGTWVLGEWRCMREGQANVAVTVTRDPGEFAERVEELQMTLVCQDCGQDNTPCASLHTRTNELAAGLDVVWNDYPTTPGNTTNIGGVDYVATGAADQICFRAATIQGADLDIDATACSEDTVSCPFQMWSAPLDAAAAYAVIGFATSSALVLSEGEQLFLIAADIDNDPSNNFTANSWASFNPWQLGSEIDVAFGFHYTPTNRSIFYILDPADDWIAVSETRFITDGNVFLVIVPHRADSMSIRGLSWTIDAFANESLDTTPERQEPMIVLGSGQ